MVQEELTDAQNKVMWQSKGTRLDEANTRETLLEDKWSSSFGKVHG